MLKGSLPVRQKRRLARKEPGPGASGKEEPCALRERRRVPLFWALAAPRPPCAASAFTHSHVLSRPASWSSLCSPPLRTRDHSKGVGAESPH